MTLSGLPLVTYCHAKADSAEAAFAGIGDSDLCASSPIMRLHIITAICWGTVAVPVVQRADLACRHVEDLATPKSVKSGNLSVAQGVIRWMSGDPRNDMPTSP